MQEQAPQGSDMINMQVSYEDCLDPVRSETGLCHALDASFTRVDQEKSLRQNDRRRTLRARGPKQGASARS
jgi:hypothetical protein